MNHMRDMIQVKTLERALRRSLTEDEMNGEYFRAVFPDGSVDYVQVQLINFPYDLLTTPEDFYVSELDSIAKVA